MSLNVSECWNMNLTLCVICVLAPGTMKFTAADGIKGERGYMMSGHFSLDSTKVRTCKCTSSKYR